MSHPESFPERRKSQEGYPAVPGYPHNATTSAALKQVKCSVCNNMLTIEPGIHVFWPLECTLCHTVYAGQHYARLPEPTAEQVTIGIGALEEYANIRGNQNG